MVSKVLLDRVLFLKQHDVLLLAKQFLDVLDPDHISDQLGLLVEAVLLGTGLNILERVFDDGNDQVLEDHVQHEGGSDEQQEADHMVGSSLVGIQVKLADGEEVHLEDGVDETNSSGLADVMNICTLFGVVVEGVREVTEGGHHDQPHDVENLQVIDHLAEQSDEVSGLLEQPHPLEHSDPQQHTGEPTPDDEPLGFHDDLVKQNRVVKNDEETDTRHLREEVHDVARVGQVLDWVPP